jgi:uncharacterized membrane protein
LPSFYTQVPVPKIDAQYDLGTNNVIPFLILVISTLVLRALGAAGLHSLDSWTFSLRGGLALMLLVTASAHWGKRRSELIAMVPPVFPRPDLMVSLTGVLEIAGALGLLVPKTATAAAACLAVLLLALFPANIRAAREKLTIGGRRVTPLPLRALLQLAFIGALIVAGFPEFFPFGVR